MDRTFVRGTLDQAPIPGAASATPPAPSDDFDSHRHGLVGYLDREHAKEFRPVFDLLAEGGYSGALVAGFCRPDQGQVVLCLSLAALCEHELHEEHRHHAAWAALTAGDDPAAVAEEYGYKTVNGLRRAVDRYASDHDLTAHTRRLAGIQPYRSPLGGSQHFIVARGQRILSRFGPGLLARHIVGMADRYLTRDEAAEIARVTIRTLQRFYSERGLPAYKVGGSIRILESELHSWLQTQRIGAQKSRYAPVLRLVADPPKSKAMPRRQDPRRAGLTDFLEATG